MSFVILCFLPSFLQFSDWHTHKAYTHNKMASSGEKGDLFQLFWYCFSFASEGRRNSL